MSNRVNSGVNPLEFGDRLLAWASHSLSGVELEQLQANYWARSQALPAWDSPPRVLLAASPPAAFLAGLSAALGAGCPLCLANPRWTPAEQQQVLAQFQPQLCWTDADWTLNLPDLPIDSAPAPATPQVILIPTGGSSGTIRFAVHTIATLTAAVQGFQAYFQRDRVNACCVLPLHHVSGLMQVWRSVLTGGQLAIGPCECMAQLVPDPSQHFLSLVPTQLQRWLETGSIEWLKRVDTVLLGGAPAWAELLETARQQQIRLAPTYGMTETASQVATLKPSDFLRGEASCGAVLPHAQIAIVSADGTPLPVGETGQLVIRSASLCLGYWDQQPWGNQPLEPLSQLHTDDLGYFDRQGKLHLVGRSSRKIITGGENVFPNEVEAAIRSTGCVQDIYVLGLSDRQWGEAVTAVYVPLPNRSLAEIQALLRSRLSGYKQPKRWIAVAQLPRNPQGKISPTAIGQLLSENQAKP